MKVKPQDYRLHSACVFHKKAGCVYVIGGYKQGENGEEWLKKCNKFNF
jgi:hypothetical protein